MDSISTYLPGSYAKHISASEIQRMKKAMKKVPVLQLQSDIYHNKEAEEAEKILWDLNHQPEHENIPSVALHSSIKVASPRYRRYWKAITHYFTSLFSA